MKLYNSLTRNDTEVAPLQDNTVRIYSCGPTVYDHAHIGNLSAYIFADTLRRVVSLSGFDTKHVMNYTDVDDKTIKRSQQDYPDDDSVTALSTLTSRFIDLFRRDMQLIGNDLEAITFISATDTIDEMKALIAELHAAGVAYVTDDGVYFSIEAYKNAGKKYGQLVEVTADNTSSERIQNDEYDKESIHDFALWKIQKPGEPAWSLHLDGKDLTGRPGWHIECSVMSRQGLGQPFDIHTGGVDLMFPHHENEIAQSTALESNPTMATIFAHNEHILVDGKKMSKSAQNFYTLQNVIDKGYDPLAFRLLVLQAHYRNQVNFTWESLEAAQNRLKNLQAWADLRHQPQANTMPTELDELFHNTRKDIQTAMENDLNTPEALACLGKLVNYMTDIAIPEIDGQYSDGTLAFIDDTFGLHLSNRPDITDEQKELIKQRQEARDSKDWAKSDELRDTLQTQGLSVRDTAFGPIWSRL